MIVLLLISILPADQIVRDKCDLIEFNDVYDSNFNHTLRQIIFRDWSDGGVGSDPGWRVRDFRLHKSEWPAVFRSGPHYVIRWHDYGGVFREVTADQIHQTWTLVDTELADRTILSKRFRRELRMVKVKNRAPIEVVD